MISVEIHLFVGIAAVNQYSIPSCQWTGKVSKSVRRIRRTITFYLKISAEFGMPLCVSIIALKYQN